MLVNVGVVDHRQWPRIGDRLRHAIDTRRVGRSRSRTVLRPSANAGKHGCRGSRAGTSAPGERPCRPGPGARPCAARMSCRVRADGSCTRSGSPASETCQLTVRFLDRLRRTAGRVGRHQRHQTRLGQRQRAVRRRFRVCMATTGGVRNRATLHAFWWCHVNVCVCHPRRSIGGKCLPDYGSCVLFGWRSCMLVARGEIQR